MFASFERRARIGMESSHVQPCPLVKKVKADLEVKFESMVRKKGRETRARSKAHNTARQSHPRQPELKRDNKRRLAHLQWGTMNCIWAAAGQWPNRANRAYCSRLGRTLFSQAPLASRNMAMQTVCMCPSENAIVPVVWSLTKSRVRNRRVSGNGVQVTCLRD